MHLNTPQPTLIPDSVSLCAVLCVCVGLVCVGLWYCDNNPSGIKMSDRLNQSSRKRRMEGYKFSTNWLPFRTQKPDDDRHSASQANKVERLTFNAVFLFFPDTFLSFLSIFSVSLSLLLACRGSIVLVNTFLLSDLLQLFSLPASPRPGPVAVIPR